VIYYILKVNQLLVVIGNIKGSLFKRREIKNLSKTTEKISKGENIIIIMTSE